MTLDSVSALSRRDLLGATLALGGLGLAPAPAAGGAAAPSTAGRPDPTVLHRKLRFRTDRGFAYWWLRGIKYGQVGTTLTPLYTNLTGTIQRITPADDGGFAMTMLEMTIALDTVTDEPLSRWKNPYTGEVLPVSFRPVGPVTVDYRADNTRVMPDELGGSRLESEGEIHAPVIVGDDVFIAEAVRARVYRDGGARPFEVNDMSHYHGSLHELADPGITMAAATVSFAEVTGWQRWMNMGEKPGNLTSRSFGAKVASFGEMPEQWRSLLKEKAPEIAADPEGRLELPPAAFAR